MLQRNVKFHGIVMYANDYREKDQLIKIFTYEYGKKVFFIKNGKKNNPNKVALFPLTYGVYEGNLNESGLSFITTVNQYAYFNQINEDIVKNAYGTYILELVDAAFYDNDIVKPYFNQIYHALKLINNGIDDQIVTNIVELKMLVPFGVAPQLNKCVLCDNPTNVFDYSDRYNGLICSKHFEQDPHRLHLSTKAVRLLHRLNNVDLLKDVSIKVDDSLKKELRKVIDLIYENHVGIHLKAKRFLDQTMNLADQL
ncbi:MAG: DNA repair protein RecO [Firmicutes bacterium]|uniref:DNA repair protein RecO n=1 Tax=Candidatus Gallilactobacillus intestinavium TaxID=2840838 RepID=A0A9D9E8R8_9LACO|nr:DNA repair protein RecO [Candidatus Gallilactobacillus intestinavium]